MPNILFHQFYSYLYNSTKKQLLVVYLAIIGSTNSQQTALKPASIKLKLQTENQDAIL